MPSLERIGVGRAGTINLVMAVMTRNDIRTYLLLEGARHVPSLVVLVFGLRLVKEDSVLQIMAGNVKEKQGWD